MENPGIWARRRSVGPPAEATPADRRHLSSLHLSRLLDRAAAGEEIITTWAGRPVARLVALAEPASRRRVPGAWQGKVSIAPDFDELPAEIEAAFQGERS